MELLISLIIFLIILLCVNWLNWLLIMLVFPFQIVFNYIKKTECSIPLKLLAVPYWLWEKIFHGGWERYMLFKVGFLPSCHVRKFVYKWLGAEIGANVVFHFKTEIRTPYKLIIGKGTIIGDNALLDARCGLEFGENVNLSSNVSIYTEQHDHRDPYFLCTDRVMGG